MDAILAAIVIVWVPLRAALPIRCSCCLSFQSRAIMFAAQIQFGGRQHGFAGECSGAYSAHRQDCLRYTRPGTARRAPTGINAIGAIRNDGSSRRDLPRTALRKKEQRRKVTAT